MRKEEIKKVLEKIELLKEELADQLKEELADQSFDKENFRENRGTFYAEVVKNQPTPKKEQEAVT